MLARLRFWSLTLLVARWTPPEGVTRTITLIPERGEVLAQMACCCTTGMVGFTAAARPTEVLRDLDAYAAKLLRARDEHHARRPARALNLAVRGHDGCAAWSSGGGHNTP